MQRFLPPPVPPLMVKDFEPKFEIGQNWRSMIRIEVQMVEHTPDDPLKDQGVGGYTYGYVAIHMAIRMAIHMAMFKSQ